MQARTLIMIQKEPDSQLEQENQSRAKMCTDHFGKGLGLIAGTPSGSKNLRCAMRCMQGKICLRW